MADNIKSPEPEIQGAEKKQRGPFKKRRAGVVLSKDEVIAIKAGRRKLRREMRAMGIKDKKEFELTASSLGLYFDKDRRLALLWWLLHGRLFWLLLGLGGVLLGALYGISYVTELQGHFTISMTDELFREGFSLSETVGFENPTSHLFASPAEGVPCISIKDIPANVDDIDGLHNDEYFAYTFYVRNDGETARDLEWELLINSESLGISDAAWVMLFVDGAMTVYAKPDENGNSQMLPSREDNTRGYENIPLMEKSADLQSQFEVVRKGAYSVRWRVMPNTFLSGSQVEVGRFYNVQPGEVHKFTVVIWLEGDDPHCTNELIGGHLGMEFHLELVE